MNLRFHFLNSLERSAFASPAEPSAFARRASARQERPRSRFALRRDRNVRVRALRFGATGSWLAEP
jgi:hypothetical protein